MKLLDLFCGAGGAAVGYHRAGFDVVGVDIAPQPNYPFEFWRVDAMHALEEWDLDGDFDAIHASPPCQAYSSLRSLWPGATYIDLYEGVRARLTAVGIPWVIENVVGAPYRQGVVLCGSMFDETVRIRRHRNFEASFLMWQQPCRHDRQADLLGVYGASDGSHSAGFKHPGQKRGPRQATTAEAREVMGMPWARKRREITEAVPPAYTEWVGSQLLLSMEAAA